MTRLYGLPLRPARKKFAYRPRWSVNDCGSRIIGPMRRLLCAFICAALVLSCSAQNGAPGTPPGFVAIDQVLSLNTGSTASSLSQWETNAPATLMVDPEVLHAGRRTVRIERSPVGPRASSEFGKVIPLEFFGKEVELRAFLRTEAVKGAAELYLREELDGRLITSTGMGFHQLRGTRDWKQYSITLPMSRLAGQLFFGVRLNGSGKVWTDGFQILIDGEPYVVSPPPDVSGSTDSDKTGAITVEQLVKALDAAHGKSDAALARQLTSMRLKERLTTSRLASMKAGLPGAKSQQALVALADASAFLDPPAPDPGGPANPNLAEKRRMIGLALDYLEKTVPRLPNFMATRNTVTYEETSPKPEAAQSDCEKISRRGPCIPQPVPKPNAGDTAEELPTWSHKADYTATVLYRNGKEVVDREAEQSKKVKEEDKGLVTSGVFGPILVTVIGDAARNGLTWSHWEQGAMGQQAVFNYVVPEAGSHYQVAYPYMEGDQTSRVLRTTGYHGQIAVDPATGSVLRMTLQADLEPGYSILRGDIMVEYAPVEIGSLTYICPVRSVAISKVWNPDLSWALYTDQGTTIKRPYKSMRVYKTTLNDVAFDNYHVFRTEVRILPAVDSPSQ